MDKFTVIVIIASVIIAASFVYSILNIYAADQLQLRGVDGEFSYYELISDGNIEVCNSFPFYVNFNKFDIVPYIEGENKGTFSTLPITLSPFSSLIVNGTFKSDTYEEIQYYSLSFDTIFSGGGSERIDPSKLSVVTEIQTPIIGVIPYSVTKQYSGMDFWNIMNGNGGNFNC